MSLREDFYTFMNKYADELNEARSSEDYKRPFGAFVRQEIAGVIRSHLDENIYKVKGSVGAGRWTDVPWIAVFDKRITSSAQRGVYIVYLLNKDTKELFLTLNQGATDVAQDGGNNSDGRLAFTRIATASNDKTTNNLKSKADTIRNKISIDKKMEYGEIRTGSKAYDAGCIYYKKYRLDSIPNDEELFGDLDCFIEAYQMYYNSVFQLETDLGDEWFPKREEYDSGLSKQDWVDILSNEKYVTDNLKNVLARYVDIGGQASVRQLILKYGDTDNYYKMSCLNLAKKLIDDGKCPEPKIGEDSRRWPVLFLGRSTKDGEEGNYVWKLRDELKNALSEINILQFLTLKEGEEEVSTKETLSKIEQYIASKGFSYDEGLIENFYLSLKSKPFVILAGTSGTGKTRLVKLFAEAVGATSKESGGNGHYKLVSVRPDWSDSSDLFGHVNLKGEFVPGVIIDFIKDASENKDYPYFLCLDEMNLARVEYYLSDFLSIIETRRNVLGQILTDEINLDKAAEKNYKNLMLPENLFVVGTVNMDETTFPFSKKVLDRANTIEFSYVDLEPDFDEQSDTVYPVPQSNEFLKSEYIVLKTDIKESQKNLVKKICTELQTINEILQSANAHVGYRVRDEIVFYMLNNDSAKLLDYEDALDNEIMQKILPRIQGSSVAIKELLSALFKKFAGDYTGLSQDLVWKQMQTFIDNKKCVYKHSAEKICYMMRRYEEDGFTSYWL